MEIVVKYRTSSRIEESQDFAQTGTLWTFKTKLGEVLTFDAFCKSPEHLKIWQTNRLQNSTNSKIEILV